MNIALSTVLIFVFLLPGLAFRRFYYTEEFSKQYFKQSFFGVFLSSFLPSLVLHSVWVSSVRIFDYYIDFVIIGHLISAKDFHQASYENIQTYLTPIIIYNSSIVLVAILTGLLFKLLIRKFKIDRTLKIFRFQNHWHYIVKGEFFEFRRASFDIKDNVEDIELFYIDALIDTEEGTILYDGFLVDYELSSEGGLEQISLKIVQRRYLKDDSKTESKQDKYYTIRGHILVIPYDKIINLNFSYYKIVPVETTNDKDEIIQKHKAVLVN